MLKDSVVNSSLWSPNRREREADATANSQDTFTRNLRLVELEATVRRADTRAAAAREDAEKAAKQLAAVEDKFAAQSAELLELRSAVEASKTSADRAARHLDDRERRSTELEREVHDLHAALRDATDSQASQLFDWRARQEQHAAAWREREVDLRRQIAEQENATQQASTRYGEEVKELQRKLEVAEATAAQSQKNMEAREQLSAQWETERDTSQAHLVEEHQKQLQATKHERDRTLQELSTVKADLLSARLEIESLSRQLERSKADLPALQESWSQLNSEAGSLRQQAEDGRKQVEDVRKELDERTGDLHLQLEQRASALIRSEMKEREDAVVCRHRVEATLRHTALELAEQRQVHSILQEHHAEMTRSHQKAVDESRSEGKRIEDAVSQVAEAATKTAEAKHQIEAMKQELKETRASLILQQQKHQQAQLSAEQLHRTVERCEWALGSQTESLAEQLAKAQQQQVEQARQEAVAESRIAQAGLDAELRAVNDTQRAEASAYEAIRDVEQKAAEEVARANAKVSLAEARTTEALQSVAEADARVETFLSEATDAHLQSAAAQAEARGRVEALARELVVAGDRSLRVEEEASAAAARAESALTYRAQQAERAAEAVAASALKAQRKAERKVSRSAERRLHLKKDAERMRQTYEQKVTKMERHLSQRDAYEDRIRHLLETEVRGPYPRTTSPREDHRQREKASGVGNLHTFGVQDMESLADRVERNVLRAVRGGDR